MGQTSSALCNGTLYSSRICLLLKHSKKHHERGTLILNFGLSNCVARSTHCTIHDYALRLMPILSSDKSSSHCLKTHLPMQLIVTYNHTNYYVTHV